MNTFVSLGLAFCIISCSANAATSSQPVSCITPQFSASGSPYWKSIVLKLTNNCGKAMNFQNAKVTYQSKTAVNTNFWGDFSPLAYPDNVLNISSQPQGSGSYTVTLNMHFPTYSTASYTLPKGKSIQLKYGVSSDDRIDGTTVVFLNSVAATGSLNIKNNTTKPSGVTSTYALVHLTLDGQKVKDVQVPWNTTVLVNNLNTGTYMVAAENIVDSSNKVYKGTSSPGSITITENNAANITLSYAAMPAAEGKINLQLGLVPNLLNGYFTAPVVLLSQNPSGSAVSKAVAWNATTVVGQLIDGASYTLSTPVIHYNGTQCTPMLSPSLLIARATSIPASTLSYQCAQLSQDTVAIDINGAPASLASLTVIFTANNNTPPVSQTVPLTNGAGNATVQLIDGVTYTLSAEPVSGYSTNFSTSSLTATPNANLTVTLAQSSNNGGRIITYVPGWKTPPTAQALAGAGYTHVMVAFGVFSTSSPGVITPAFNTVTKAYIDSLHQAGIKVLLSLGGASTSIAGTTVDFHQALTLASSPDAFKQTFINSLKGLITQYGFDGFDIDIEHGLNGGGTFTQPQGDIAVLASIINTLYSQNPNLLITLTPQVANIAATSGFDGTWGNYAALTLQTHHALAWVGIQLYNTGCAYGINQVCYGPSPVSSPDFSVAMATDLLENWPAKLADGRNTGFQPYITYLKPSQVVIGYPVPNASGASDGAPVTPTTTIRRALQCLKTAVASASSCGSYVPPKAYGAIGGVFNWEATYDQNNSFKFAQDLKPCVLNGLCN